MAHYAKIKNGKVTKVIVAESDFINSFIDGQPGKWIQTSYNTRGGVHYDPDTGLASSDQSKALRKNFAGIGYTYDLGKDAFIPPKPFPSWTLNSTSCLWEAPIPLPDDDNFYLWNEETQQWDQE
jgi:hypothetical protein